MVVKHWSEHGGKGDLVASRADNEIRRRRSMTPWVLAKGGLRRACDPLVEHKRNAEKITYSALIYL